MKVLAFLVTAAINVGIGIVLFFLLLVALNGYTEKQAGPGLILYTGWVVLFALLSGFLSFVATTLLVKRRAWSAFGAAALATAVLIVVGAVFTIAGMIAAFVLIEVLR